MPPSSWKHLRRAYRWRQLCIRRWTIIILRVREIIHFSSRLLRIHVGKGHLVLYFMFDDLVRLIGKLRGEILVDHFLAKLLVHLVIANPQVCDGFLVRLLKGCHCPWPVGGCEIPTHTQWKPLKNSAHQFSCKACQLQTITLWKCSGRRPKCEFCTV